MFSSITQPATNAQELSFDKMTGQHRLSSLYTAKERHII